MNSKRKRVMVFIDWFYPGFKAGGILRSVYNLVNKVDDVDFFIVTRNTDLGSDKPYENVDSNVWLRQNNYQIIYLSPSHETVSGFSKLIKKVKPDSIYTNSIFSIRYTLIPILISKFVSRKIKIVMAVHGMLGSGAISIKKTKKVLYLNLMRVAGVFKNITWHASNESEQNDVQKYISKNALIKIAPNIAEFSKVEYSSRIKEEGAANLFFISRVSPKKNLLFAIELLMEVKSDVNFKVIGPAEDKSYLDQCMHAVSKLPSNINVKFAGEIGFNEVIKELAKFHFFLFPTQHENFGNVIIESLFAGCPVIISDQTPFQDLEENNAGWKLPLNEKDAWVSRIEKVCNMGQDEFNKMSEAAHNYAIAYSNNDEVIKANAELFS
jgi:glycosyltransferase involved in cell wall biosynthesis